MLMVEGLLVVERGECMLHESDRLYASQGRLSEAEAMFERALRGCEKALGAEHTGNTRGSTAKGILPELFRDVYAPFAARELAILRFVSSLLMTVGP